MAEFSCTACDLHTGRGRNYVKGRGNSKAAIFIVGSGPSRSDSDKGAPFMADPGLALDRALKAAGLDRASVFCSNLVRCWAAGGKPQPPHVMACAGHLDREVSYVGPKVLVLLGDAAIRAVLGREPTASTKASVWDSGECARSFTFARGDAHYMDEATGEITSRPRAGAFTVVAGPDPEETQGNPSAAKDLARAMSMAAQLAAGKAFAARDYQYSHDEDSAFRMLSKLLDRCHSEKILSFDAETSGLVGYPRMHDPYKADILTLSFVFRPTEGYGVALRPRQRSPRVVAALRKLLEHPIQKLGHGGAFDNVLLRHDMGIKVRNYALDTFVGAYALDQDSNAKGLDDLAQPVRPDLGRWWEKVEPYLDRKRTGYLNCPDDILLEYNVCDSDATLSVWEDQGPKLLAQGRMPLFTEILMPHYREIAEMQYFGVRLDVDAAKAVGRRMLAKIRESEAACLAKIGRHPQWWGPEDLAAHGVARADFRPINLSSGPQLAELIYKDLKVPVLVKSESGAPSTALEALEPLKKEHPFIADLLAYRKDEKFVSSFIGWEAKDKPAGADNLDLFRRRPMGARRGSRPAAGACWSAWGPTAACARSSRSTAPRPGASASSARPCRPSPRPGSCAAC